ncbi:MAG TPA: hypothetical protein VGN91_01215, partial [Bosea sp. (in: a-proteobacteria)]|nr:hypothetical protein [Bosea sp. (in: a-proteobacteria)]
MIRAAGLALGLLAAAISMTGAEASPPSLPTGARAEPVAPAALAGWGADDQIAILRLFAQGCETDPPLRQGAPPPPALPAL